MALHLLKIAVGCDSVEQIAEFQAERLKRLGRLVHYTRHFPRRAEELLDGGSMYWIVKGLVRARQRLTGFEHGTRPSGGPASAIGLDPKLVLTRPQPRRPHQGWRYLEPADAPPDAPKGAAGDDDLPPKMVEELRALGLL
jgi:hypothetical protein